MKTKTKGRPPDVKRIRQAKLLRIAGLSIRAISRAILNRNDPKTIYRWLKYELVDKNA